MGSVQRRLRPIRVASLVAAALAAAGVTAAAAAVRVHAELHPGAVVPQPVGALRASGSFSASFPEEGTRPRFLWTIIFGGLTGPVVQADLRVGRPGVAGGILFPLCHSCRSGQSGSTKLTLRGVRLIESGRTYVEVRTPKNPAGEIRGQLLVRR